MQQAALFMPSRSALPSWNGSPEPVSAYFNAAELDLGYEVAYPFLTSPVQDEDPT